MDNSIGNITTLDNDPRPQEADTLAQLISPFLTARSDTYRDLAELRREGWNNPEGDKHFKKQRQAADEASPKDQKYLYDLMRRIGDEIQDATGALNLARPNAKVLDICMAPGGYSASALKYSPHAHVSSITLPRVLGGHSVLIPYGRKDPRVVVKFADITMLAAEYGVEDIPKDHPDILNLSRERPWATESFDLVFCDGQVLRIHTPKIASYRQQCEASRLTCSQLILAMQRIKPGGTLIMLLHKVEMLRTIKLLSIFDKISELELFKPTTSHKTRSSFYLIAKNVQPNQPEALVAIDEWKESWKNATFPLSTDEWNQQQADFVKTHVLNEEVSSLLTSFGERLIELGEPVWRIQKTALKGARWFRPSETTAGQMGAPGSSASVDPTNVSSKMDSQQIGK